MGKKGGIRTYKPSMKDNIKWHFKHFRIYCFTSFIDAILMFGLLFILTTIFKIHYILSFTITYIIITTNSFILNKLFVFKFFNPKKLHKQYSQFFIVSVTAFILNFIALYFLVEFLGVWYLLAQLIIATVGLPPLYLSHRIMVFNHI